MSSVESTTPMFGVISVFFQGSGLSPAMPLTTLSGSGDEGPKMMTSYFSRSLALSRAAWTEM